MSKTRLLVTGASGFVGTALCDQLIDRGYRVSAVLRNSSKFNNRDCEIFNMHCLSANTDWTNTLNGVTTVIHLAARVHVMRDDTVNPVEEFRRVNVDGTEHLARSAAESGVKRFVYISSIKVNGEVARDGKKFIEEDWPYPQDPYGISKWESEKVLHRIAEETGLEVVIVRPPLVYGAGVKGNFAQMLKVLATRLPLPFASIENQRSLVYVGNLVDALIACATHPAATGQTYLIRDGEDISTPDLLRHLGIAMGRPARLFSFPPSLLTWAAAAVGRAEQLRRLTGSLQVDDAKIRRELNWTPPFTLQQGLHETAKWYRDTHL